MCKIFRLRYRCEALASVDVHIVKRNVDVLLQRWLVRFDANDEITTLLDDLLCDLFLAARGIDRHDDPFETEVFEELRNRRYRIRLFIRFDLSVG